MCSSDLAGAAETPVLRIPGWQTILVGDHAEKGSFKPGPSDQFSSYTGYKAFGIEDDEWILICKTEETLGDSSEFTFRCTRKELNESLAGLMIRESNLPGTPYWFIGCSKTKYINHLNGNPDYKEIPSREGVIYFKFIVKNISGQIEISGSYGGDEIRETKIKPFHIDFSGRKFLIGYAFATGNTPRGALGPSITISSNF